MPDRIQHTKIEKLLLEAARTFNSTLEYEELIERVLKLVLAAVNSEAAIVFRVDHKRTDMKVRALRIDSTDIQVFERELGQGVLGWVAQYRQPVIIDDAANDDRVDDEMNRMLGIDVCTVVSVPLIGKGKMIGVIEAINKLDGPFGESDVDILVGLSNQIAVAIDNANLYRDVKREALEKDLLYKIGMKLSATLSLDEVLEVIMDSLRQTVHFNVGGVFVVDSEEGRIGSIYTEGYDPALEADLQLKIGQGLVGHVASSGEPVIVEDVLSDDRYVNANPSTRSEIVVPIKIDHKVVGVFNLESDHVNAFDDHNMALIEAFASQAALSIERARMHQQILAGRSLQEQVNIAREIQQSFLPKQDPKAAGYDITGCNIPSGQVGGDYYDFIKIVDGQTGIAIADVSGKGVPAALIMASVRASLIAEIRNNYSIRTICKKVNNLLCESLKPGNFVTGLYSVLDSRNHILTFVNCGHDRPILFKASGEIEYLADGGPILGVTPDAVYQERPIFLNPGDLVFMFTDGVSEVFDRNGDQFGYEGIESVLAKHRHRKSSEILDAVYDAVRKHAAPDHVYDDLTMIAIKRI